MQKPCPGSMRSFVLRSRLGWPRNLMIFSFSLAPSLDFYFVTAGNGKGKMSAEINKQGCVTNSKRTIILRQGFCGDSVGNS